MLIQQQHFVKIWKRKRIDFFYCHTSRLSSNSESTIRMIWLLYRQNKSFKFPYSLCVSITYLFMDFQTHTCFNRQYCLSLCFVDVCESLIIHSIYTLGKSKPRISYFTNHCDIQFLLLIRFFLAINNLGFPFFLLFNTFSNI